MKDNKIQIRNSTTDFLIFTKQAGEDGIEVRVHDENVWLTQKSMALLFDCSTDNIGLHLKKFLTKENLIKKQLLRNPRQLLLMEKNIPRCFII